MLELNVNAQMNFNFCVVLHFMHLKNFLAQMLEMNMNAQMNFNFCVVLHFMHLKNFLAQMLRMQDINCQEFWS